MKICSIFFLLYLIELLHFIRYGPSGFAVVCIPTDQGYFEPDTSALIRLKLRAEYGYGINPATALTDKINLLGTGANPFARWIQGKCRTPAGLGRIQVSLGGLKYLYATILMCL